MFGSVFKWPAFVFSSPSLSPLALAVFRFLVTSFVCLSVCPSVSQCKVSPETRRLGKFSLLLVSSIHLNVTLNTLTPHHTFPAPRSFPCLSLPPSSLHQHLALAAPRYTLSQASSPLWRTHPTLLPCPPSHFTLISLSVSSSSIPSIISSAALSFPAFPG